MCVCVGIKQIKSNEQWLFYWLGTFTIPNTLTLWYANAFILSLKPGEIIIRINFVVIVKSFCILQLTGMCIQIKNGWLYVAGRPQRPPRKKRNQHKHQIELHETSSQSFMAAVAEMNDLFEFDMKVKLKAIISLCVKETKKKRSKRDCASRAHIHLN